jgi:hypothetical protein
MVRSVAISAFTRVFDALRRRVSNPGCKHLLPSFETRGYARSSG